MVESFKSNKPGDFDRTKHMQRIGVLGGTAKYKKYGSISGDEKKRKEAWRKWWDEVGQFKKIPILSRKPINKPEYSEELAEFVGIMMGDGGMTKYFATISLNSETEVDYSLYISALVKKLFGINTRSSIRKTCKELDIVMNRSELVEFCQTLGLKKGNKLKQGLDIPDWVKGNKKYLARCIRGLVDTDGCMFIHKYISNGKMYKYQKIAFTSASPVLIKSFYEALAEFGIKSRITYNGLDVRIESKDGVKKYLELIGTSNRKK